MSNNIRILIVDDSPYVLEAIGRTLHCIEADWEMETADSGEGALELFRTNHFDVLVTDLKMPGMDGEELISEVRALSPATPCVVLSGDADDYQARAIASRGYPILEKPCEAQVLRAMITDELNRRAA